MIEPIKPLRGDEQQYYYDSKTMELVGKVNELIAVVNQIQITVNLQQELNKKLYPPAYQPLPDTELPHH